MRAVRMLASPLAVLSVFAVAANAQYPRTVRGPAVPSRWSVGGDFTVSQPKGEFGEHAPTGYGGNVVGLFKLDQRGIFSIRADLGGLQYGSETKRVPFLPYTGRVLLDVITRNDIFWGAIGPQMMLITTGPIRPYANAAIAVQDFVTETSLSGSDDSNDYASTTNSEDATLAFIFGGGTYISFSNNRTYPVLNLSARYHFGGTARYLRKGDITDNPDGSITLHPVTSKTDFVLWQIGVIVPISIHSR